MGSERDKYLSLVRQFPLRPIRSESELDRAVRVVDSLIDRPALSPGEKDYLAVLTDLVEAYEDEHIPVPQVPDDRMLRHLIDARGVTQVDLARATGIASSTISAVLQGERRLTRQQVGAVAAYFGVDPGAFLFGDVARRSEAGREDEARRRMTGPKKHRRVGA